jgi:thiol-disulfide isomerase/thioredoxin
MKKLIISALYLLPFCIVTISAQDQKISETETAVPVYEQFVDMEHLLHFNNDTTYVVNFWATWCGPCVKELPYFEQLHETYTDQKIKIILVSLDFPRQIKTNLIPFIEKRQLKSEVVVLTDGAYNDWIDKVDESWDGAIPVTLVYRGDKRYFTAKEFQDFEALNNIIKQFIIN